MPEGTAGGREPYQVLIDDEQPQEAIRKELEAGNDLGVQFVIPEQGTLYHFQ